MQPFIQIKLDQHQTEPVGTTNQNQKKIDRIDLPK